MRLKSKSKLLTRQKSISTAAIANTLKNSKQKNKCIARMISKTRITSGGISGSKKSSKGPFKTVKQLELFLLLNTLIIMTMHLKLVNMPDIQIKRKITKLLKNVRKNNKFIPANTTDSTIRGFVNIIFNISLYIMETGNGDYNLMDKKGEQEGGFFFRNMEDKADQPITGADVTRLLDEIQQFFYNAQYVEEGQFLRDTNTVLSMLRGDTQQFKSILQYQIFPKYYSPFPPFIKWDAIKQDFIDKPYPKWHDIPDYLLAYQTYLKLRDEYLVEKGLKSPSVLTKGVYGEFFTKAANSLSTNIYNLERLQRASKGQFFPLSLPA